MFVYFLILLLITLFIHNIFKKLNLVEGLSCEKNRDEVVNVNSAKIKSLDKVITNVDNVLKVLKKDVGENKTRTITNEKSINATSKKSDEKANAKMKEMS
mgnify:FL=1